MGRDVKSPLRRCAVSGIVRPTGEMVRFVADPNGGIVPDLDGRLPGRGVWLTADRGTVDQAIRKRAFARSLKQAVTAPDDLGPMVGSALRQRCLNLVGLARRAGLVVAGFEKVRAALKKGEVAVIVTASDGAEDGAGKIGAMAPDLPRLTLFDAASLGGALGRDIVVHAALKPGGLTDRLLAEAGRYQGFHPETAGTRSPDDGKRGAGRTGERTRTG